MLFSVHVVLSVSRESVAVAGVIKMILFPNNPNKLYLKDTVTTSNCE